MRCPNCLTTLKDNSAIGYGWWDYCPRCHAVYIKQIEQARDRIRDAVIERAGKDEQQRKGG